MTQVLAASRVTILALGDSLTAGYGLPAEAAWPLLLEKKLQADGLDARVINAGVSADTTAGGLNRLEWALEENPDVAIVELGANDALRGLDPRRTEANLDAILNRLREKGVRVLFTGMYAPLNMGEAYTSAFNAVFPRLAAKHGVAFYPFFLEGVATKPDLNQADGMHPNAAGSKVLVERLYPEVKALLPAPAN